MLHSIIEATSLLADVARTAAALRDWPLVVEFATGSESTYVHLRRGATASWVGLRISAHPPAYACSRDYQACLLPKNLDRWDLERGRLETMAFVESGDVVVADPQDVRREIWRHEIRSADGEIHIDADDHTWRWCGLRGRWHWHHRDTPQPIDAFPPPRTPRKPIQTAAAAAIRHRLNQREKWTAEIRRLAVNSPTPG